MISLLLIEEINPSLKQINRIARQSVLLSLDSLTKEYIDSFSVAVFDHSKISLPESQDDYRIRGWTSPTTGITIKTRMIYAPKTKWQMLNR